MDVLRSRYSPEPVLAAEDSRTAMTCRHAVAAADLDEHYRIRRSVFVEEQRLFVADEHDEHDDDPRTIHVLGLVGGVPSGTVRLYPVGTEAEPGLWKGDRLAVCSGHRSAGIGGPLVEHAVAVAGAAGGTRMFAWVQVANVLFFQHLGWEAIGTPELYVGQPHQQMSIGLS